MHLYSGLEGINAVVIDFVIPQEPGVPVWRDLLEYLHYPWYHSNTHTCCAMRLLKFAIVLTSEITIQTCTSKSAERAVRSEVMKGTLICWTK